MEKTITKTNTQKDAQAKRKQLEGVVVSDKMKDTVVVLIERYIKDTKYHKFLNIRKRFKVHNPGNTVKVGDKVTIESCRPISRHKSFVVVSANGTAVATK